VTLDYQTSKPSKDRFEAAYEFHNGKWFVQALQSKQFVKETDGKTNCASNISWTT